MTELTPEQKKELIQAAKNMQIAMAPMISQMQDTARKIAPQIEALRKQILPTLKSIELWQKSFIPLFDKIDFEKLEQKAKEMNALAFKKFIKEWGWLVNNKSITFGDYCYGLYKKKGDKKFKYEVCKWFYSKKNLDSVFDEIKEKFPLRSSIIKEGLSYHYKRRYDCAMVLLFPQTEGILWDLGMTKELVKKGYNSKLKIKKHNSIGKWELSELSKKLFPKNKFHNILIKELFCDGPRNKVLHGRYIYNKKQKEISRWRSTLIILALWRLSDEF